MKNMSNDQDGDQSDEIDPLDAFMNGIDEQVKKETKEMVRRWL